MNKTKKIIFSALIAAIYTILTLPLATFAYGPIQARFSEALTVLPFFSFFSVIGLTVGCAISNMYSQFGLIDIIFGSLATFLAGSITYLIGKSNFKFKRIIAPLPAIIINAIVVGILINIVAMPNVSSTTIPSSTPLFSKIFLSIKNYFLTHMLNTKGLFIAMLEVGIGEFIVCYLLGFPLIKVIEKNRVLKEYLSDYSKKN